MERDITINKFCVITPNYPLPSFPERGAFVENLVRQWEGMGLIVDVVAPLSLPNLLRSLKNNRHQIHPAGRNVVRPLYLSLSNKRLGPIDLKAISKKKFLKAAARGVRASHKPDVFYGKFLLSGGIAALNAGKMYNRPTFADMGESVFLDTLDSEGKALASEVIASLHGIVCVSKRLRDEIVELGAEPEKILVAPNEADPDKFMRLDKTECRDELGLPQEAFIVAFTGHFIDRKGPLRVLKAIEMTQDSKIFGVFLGQGPQKPEGEQVLHAAPVPNTEVPVWLNASDVFVLPTLAEGSCNAINEAIACGLPFITSNIPDVRDQVPSGSGVLIDPHNVEALSFEISKIKKGKDSRSMNNQSDNRSKGNTFQKPAQRCELIYEWMCSLC